MKEDDEDVEYIAIYGPGLEEGISAIGVGVVIAVVLMIIVAILGGGWRDECRTGPSGCAPESGDEARGQ